MEATLPPGIVEQLAPGWFRHRCPICQSPNGQFTPGASPFTATCKTCDREYSVTAPAP